MAEKTFDLQTSEQIVRKEAFVRCGSWSAFTGELVLANQTLVYVNRGLFGNHEGYMRFELTEIAQAIFGEAQNGNYQLEVCYRGVSLWFCQPLDSSNRAMLTPAPPRGLAP